MKKHPRTSTSSEKGSVLIFVVVTMTILLVVGSIGTYISTQVRVAAERKNLEIAYQYASGGASLVASDLAAAFQSSPNDVEKGLVEAGYTLDESRKAYSSYFDNGGHWDEQILRSLTYTAVWGDGGSISSWPEQLYERKIASSELGEEVTAEIWLIPGYSEEARIVTSATVGNSTEYVTMNLGLSYGFGGAIISTNVGSSDTGASKKVGQKGNVAIYSANSNSTYVDGGVLANGTVSYNEDSSVDPDEIQQELYTTEDEIPNYTNPGSADQLFDFDRFTAVADAMGTNYADTDAFKAAVAADADGVLEGVIVVNIEGGADDFEDGDFPSGINVLGTLILKFDPDEWDADDKLKVLCTVNVNPADLSGLDTSDPDTFTSGYPPTMSSSSNYAHNQDISGAGFQNFSSSDDLPAIMYNTAIADFHGNLNVSGVIYSPVFAEIENKKDGQVQYIKGSVIVGGGIWYENKKDALSIISYDPNALDRLATNGANGKSIILARRD